MIGLYFFIINCLGLSMMGLDKLKAKRQMWRISEKVIFSIALLGGSLGIWVGMYMFHHKSHHWKFILGIPLIIVCQIIVLVFLQGLNKFMYF